MIKALFFDIDGTLVSFKSHEIPESTVRALEKAKENGIRIYISTGRPIPFITNIDKIKHLVDGYITTNGGYCFVGNSIVCINAIPKNDVETLLELSDNCKFPVILVGQRKITVVNTNPLVNEIFVENLKVHSDAMGDSLEEVLAEPILQATAFLGAEEQQIVMSRLAGCISGRWHQDFTDITSTYADKGKGLQAIAAHEDLLLSNCMAFGDGGNDISIIKAAGVGVAMGNAGDDVKFVADYITTSVDEDGIANALKHYGVI
jgi:Cof subfamily protein (haloacid dehalogenase superfamily)